MIDVSVAQYDCVEAGWIERKRVAIAGLIFCSALDQTTIQQNRFAANLDKMARTGYFLSGTAGLYLQLITPAKTMANGVASMACSIHDSLSCMD